MSVEESFGKLLGRQPSEEERARLYRVREALGLSDNDAFWAIVLALEHYDGYFRQYPERLARATEESIAKAREAFAAAAAVEAARGERLLAQRVAETSVTIARKLAERPFRLDQVTVGLAALVAFGALCVHAGYHLAAASPRPFWVTHEVTRPGLLGSLQRGLGAVLGVPAGWMVLVMLLPMGAYGCRLGWRMARDAGGQAQEARLGWCMLLTSALASVGVAAVLLAVT